MRVRLLLAVLALLAMVGGAGCGLVRVPSVPIPAPAPGAGLQLRTTVRPGVLVAGRDVGGMRADDAEQVLTGLAVQLDRAPQNAHMDPRTQGLVPGLDGVRLDTAATLGRVLGARAGEDVAPVLRPVPPRVGLADLRAAPIYGGLPSRPLVAFVINVAWGGEYIPAMLRVIAAEHAAVTWCLVGRWAETHPNLVHEMVATGNDSGAPAAFCNHGYTDHGWALLGEAQAEQSITRADQAIEALTGEKPLYFSPHKGEYNNAVLTASRTTGHELVLWSLDTIDWRNPPASTVRMRVVGRAKAGDIVLMHPTAPTAEALAAMIAGVRAKGLRLVTLDTLLSPERGPWDQGVG